MTDREFVRRLRRYARERGLAVEYLPSRGRGSHAMIRLGTRTTTLSKGEIHAGRFHAMLRQLEIDKRDF